MKVIMSMAITADGFIAKSNDDTSYLSEEGWDEFNARVSEIGNIIMGRKTYDIMFEDKSIEGIKNATIVVLSSSKTGDVAGIHYEASAENALAYLDNKGFDTALLSGGASTNTAFMNAGLVDEVWLDVEPTLIGKGVNLLELKEQEVHLKLIDTKKLSKNVIQLRYELMK
ncbi:MAG TPA: dihydrofolate reductase family protein [Candidatus Saccharimonadales bacterium]|jgi:dihydrofolate reductase